MQNWQEPGARNADDEGIGIESTDEKHECTPEGIRLTTLSATRRRPLEAKIFHKYHHVASPFFGPVAKVRRVQQRRALSEMPLKTFNLNAPPLCLMREMTMARPVRMCER